LIEYDLVHLPTHTSINFRKKILLLQILITIDVIIASIHTYLHGR